MIYCHPESRTAGSCEGGVHLSKRTETNCKHGEAVRAVNRQLHPLMNVHTSPSLFSSSRSLAAAVAILAGCVAPAAQADTFTLGANHDSMAYSFLTGWTMDSVYPNIIAAANTGTSNHHMAGFIQFNLAPLAGFAGEDITSATMRLFVLGGEESGFGAGPSSAYPATIDYRLLQSSWNEATITWNNQPGGPYNAATTQPPGAIAGTFVVNTTGAWIDVDITSIVQDWVDDPAGNFGLRLTQATELRDGNGAAVFPTFASLENETEANRPQLVVQTAAVPEPGSAALLGLSVGVLGSMRRRRNAAR